MVAAGAATGAVGGAGAGSGGHGIASRRGPAPATMGAVEYCA